MMARGGGALMRRVNPLSERGKNTAMLLCVHVCACVCQKHLSTIGRVSRPSGSLLSGHLDGGKNRIKEQCVCVCVCHYLLVFLKW